MIKFRNRYFIETLENNETNSGHKHNAHMYSSFFQKHLMMNQHFLVLRFSQKLFTKVMMIVHIMPHQDIMPNQDIFIQYNEGFNFITGTASADFKDAHVANPEGAPPITSYTKANIRNGYVIPQESPVYHKSEKFGFFRIQN